jgi:signal transduction histidine kinase
VSEVINVPEFGKTQHYSSPRRSFNFNRVDSSARGLRLEALANLAHELRSPMQALIGYLDILGDELTASLTDRQKHLFKRMNVNAQDLAQTVENVMEFATEEFKQRTSSEDIMVADLVAELAPALEAANCTKNLSIEFKLDRAPAVLRSNRPAVRSILLNLALNAIKFTDEGSVTISIIEQTAVVDKPTLEIVVTDTGRGIDAALINRAFEACAQLSHTSARTHRGLGLGLAVVQRNAMALGATVIVHSMPRQGSTFIVAIPMNGTAAIPISQGFEC